MACRVIPRCTHVAWFFHVNEFTNSLRLSLPIKAIPRRTFRASYMDQFVGPVDLGPSAVEPFLKAQAAKSKEQRDFRILMKTLLPHPLDNLGEAVGSWSYLAAMSDIRRIRKLSAFLNRVGLDQPVADGILECIGQEG